MSNNLLVIGSSNVDFLIRSEHLPAIGETVTDGYFMQTYGGKGANQAVGAARAGGNVTFVSCLGEDFYADNLIKQFIIAGINTSYIFKEKDTATGSALIMIDKNGNNYLSVAPGSNYRMGTKHIDQALPAIVNADIILLQMEIPFETTSYIFDLSGKHKKKIIFNLAPARPFDLSVLSKVYIFIVNEVEAAMVTGLKADTDEEIIFAAKDLLSRGPEIVIITLGERGSYVVTSEMQQFVPAYKVDAVDTTGAGDIFCGTLAVALTEGKTIIDSVRFAGAASAISVTRLGAQPSAPVRADINTFLEINNLKI